MYYRLIDGPFFLGVCREALQLEGLSNEPQLNLAVVSAGAFRTIFYDALPVQKTSQSDSEFNDQLNKKVAFLNTIRNFPNMQVRDGITRLRTKGRERSLSEVLEQKGVDTWIAVDAVKYALTDLAITIEIITSDSDIYPVFEVLRETRSKGILVYSVGSTRDELVFSADEARALRASLALGWMGIECHSESGGGHIQIDDPIGIEEDQVLYTFGFAGGKYLANRTPHLGNPQWFRTDRFCALVDWLNDFGPIRSWSRRAEELSDLRLRISGSRDR